MAQAIYICAHDKGHFHEINKPKIIMENAEKKKTNIIGSENSSFTKNLKVNEKLEKSKT